MFIFSMETSVEQAVASTLMYVYMMIHESSQKIRKERKGRKKKEEVQSRSIQSKPTKGREDKDVIKME